MRVRAAAGITARAPQGRRPRRHARRLGAHARRPGSCRGVCPPKAPAA